MNDDVKIPAAATGVRSDQASFTRLINGGLQAIGFIIKLAAHIDESGMGLHGETGDQGAFHQFMRVMAQDFPVFARAGLGLIGVDD